MRLARETTIRIMWVSACSGENDGRDALRAVRGVTVLEATSAGECLSHLRASPFDAVVARFPLPDWTPDELLEEIKRIDPSVHVLIADPRGGVADVVRWMKLGAYHFLDETAPAEELVRQIELITESRRSRSLVALAAAVESDPCKQLLVGNSRAMERVWEIVRLVGKKRCTVLITGETGTGKEMVARAIHKSGDRAHLPMVAVNCSTLPESLLEAELFGHVKGAFTGALAHRIGRFEQANGSTIFFDEIGDMPPDLQAKLLRVLQEREFQRIGSSETIRVDVRVIAATNVNLAERVAQGKFREDLYYRLNVVPVRTPPLRERPGDIPLLVEHFLEKVCGLEQIPVKQVTPETLDRLTVYSWPGNVRQLENAVEMAVALSGNRQTLYPTDFHLPPAQSRPTPVGEIVSVPDEGLDFDETVSRIERSILQQALQKTSGNKKQAAEMLRLKRTTLSAKLRSLEASA